MSRSPKLLRRGILGIAFAGILGFGATQALATPTQARSGTCLYAPFPYDPPGGCWECEWGGYCSGGDTNCTCYDPPQG
jgi:hypothetical protein